MNRLHIIVLTESFLLNRGLQMMLSKIRGINVVDCIELPLDLLPLLQNQNINLILVSNALFNRDLHLQKLFKTNKNIKWALIETKAEPKNNAAFFEFLISLNDPESIIQNAFVNYLQRFNSASKSEPTESELSEREKDILKQVALGLTNAEIADKLFISQHTVITHRKNITTKLGIKTISGLTVYALMNELIEMGDVDSLK